MIVAVIQTPNMDKIPLNKRKTDLKCTVIEEDRFPEIGWLKQLLL